MMINVMLPGAAEMTQLDESELLKLEGDFENDDELVKWTQYHLRTTGEMVHRSVHVHLKKAIFGAGAAAAFG